MPMMPPAACIYHRCREMAYRGDLCATHAAYYKRLRQQRPNPVGRGYDAAWRRIRKAFIEANPFCHGRHHEPVPAQEVDHIVPLKAGGTNATGNLQALCRSCHTKKTKRQKSAVAR